MAWLTCMTMTDCIKALDLLLLFSSMPFEYLKLEIILPFQLLPEHLSFANVSTMVEKDAMYLVPKLRDLAFSVDIRCV